MSLQPCSEFNETFQTAGVAISDPLLPSFTTNRLEAKGLHAKPTPEPSRGIAPRSNPSTGQTGALHSPGHSRKSEVNSLGSSRRAAGVTSASVSGWL
ncbi:unnamed protein product [Protopolystoma xenopodis]|uniref:Uncharacterized protein n=1 Tax=Protopolystoma xenopodis TaxID=117903 RepID=A0A3S5FGV4_9PLAT|nr:unnamed protein product [Protopolystoma xenopodis]